MTDTTNTEPTLEDAIRGMLGNEEPEEELFSEADDPIEEDPKESTDGTQEAQENEETPGQVHDDPVEEIATKLDELEAKYGKPDGEDPWLHVKAEEQFLLNEQAELQRGFLAGLPDIGNEAGKSIYDMDEKQFDAFLQELDDDGKERLKFNAIQAREAALANAKVYQRRKDEFEARLQQYRQVNLEMEVITDLARQLGLPDVVKKYKDGSITKSVRKMAETDPGVVQKAMTKEGLYQLAISAIRELGIAPSKDEKTKIPSAPDAKAVSKKVKPAPISDSSDEALLAKATKMSASEYNKLDAKTRERLMYASIRDQL